MEVKFEYTNGKRVDSRLVYTTLDKQLFILKRYGDSGAAEYRCYIKNCKAKVSVVQGICRRVKNYEAHCHGNQEEVYKNFVSDGKIKLQCQNETEAIKTVYDKVLQSDSELNASQFKKLKPALLYNKKKKKENSTESIN